MNPTVPLCKRVGWRLLLLSFLVTLPACRAEDTELKALRKKAQDGDLKAQTSLAWMYFNGEGVGKDLAEASQWYRKSAEQNDAGAQFNLGSMYAKGLGVELDHKEAPLGIGAQPSRGTRRRRPISACSTRMATGSPRTTPRR